MFIVATPSFGLSMDSVMELRNSAPYGSSASSSEDSFELRVLSEPWRLPLHRVESSIQKRVLILENQNSPFLLGKEKGDYWGEIQESLNSPCVGKYYLRILNFENRDLQIRERKHSCYEVFRGVLLKNPYLKERAAYSPEEAFCDFLNERRDTLEISNPGSSPAEKDHLEITYLIEIERDLLSYGDKSIYIRQAL